jgi:RNA polymerase sigma-70 factor (ECF subfamily)
METAGVLREPLAAGRQWDAEETGSAGLGALYDAHAAPLYRYLLTLLSDPEDAQDALQEVFLGVLRRPTGTAIENLQAYLFRAARNQALMLLRSRRNRRESPNGAYSWVDLQACGPDQCEVAVDVNRAICSLPLPQREVIVLRLGEGLTFREIAVLLSVRQNTVYSRYRLAVGKLRALLAAGPARGGDEHA